MIPHMLVSALATSGEISSTDSKRILPATACKASSGHALNQSMVQQLTKEGN